jgi:DNA-binding transcriptional regulator YbjK
VDGRRARGEARRAALVQAALVVLERDGVGGLTHRAIADEAGVSLASASYHFKGIDDLILTALLGANEELVDDLARQTAPPSLHGLAECLAADLRDRRRLFVAYYELYLHAARKPELRGPAMAWLDLLTDHYAPALAGKERDAFQATIEGLCLHAIVRGESPSAADLAAALELTWPQRS